MAAQRTIERTLRLKEAVATAEGNLDTARDALAAENARRAANGDPPQGAGDAEFNAEAAAATALTTAKDALTVQIDGLRDPARRADVADQGKTPMLELCTGRIPQHPVITSARIDPKSVLGTWPGDGDFPAEYYKCPPNVPLFTTKDVLVGGVGFNRNGKRFRPDEYEECVPVIAHIPSAVRLATFVNASKLIFIGMSYGSVSKNNVVAVVGKGLMPSPHNMTKDTFHRFIGKKVWWKRANGPYGTADGPTIAVPALTARDDTDTPRIEAPDSAVSTDIFDTVNKMGNIVVQSADICDCSILIG